MDGFVELDNILRSTIPSTEVRINV